MQRITKSAAYLYHSPHSYYFRIRVPEDLKSIIDKGEVRCSLRTGRLSIAKSRAGIIAGNIKQLFNAMRSGMTNIPPKQIQEIINKYIRDELQSDTISICCFWSAILLRWI